MPLLGDIALAEPNVDLLKDYLQKRFAISNQDTKYLKNATKAELLKEVNEVKTLAKELNQESDRKLLFIVVYSGHGC